MNNTKIKIAIYAVGFTSMFFFAVANVLSLIKADPIFSNLNTTLLQMMITIPALVSIPASLALDKMTTKISKKKIAIISIVLMVVGGVAPAFLSNYFIILLMRGLVGLSIGITIPLAPSLVVDYFDGHERNKVIGFAQASTALGGIVASYGAGFLAVFGWRASFLVYLLACPVLLLAILFLPESGKIIRENESVSIASMTPNARFICIMIFLSMICTMTFSTNISMLMKNEALGSPVGAGTAISMFTLGSFILGLTLGPMSKLLKRFTFPVSISLVGAGLLIIGFAPTLFAVIAGSIICGFGSAGIVAQGSVLLAGAVSLSASALAISLGIAGMNLGQFLSPFIITPLSNVFGNGSERARYIIAGIFVLIFAAIVCSYNIFGHSNKRAITKPEP
jgi:MFS family permease